MSVTSLAFCIFGLPLPFNNLYDSPDAFLQLSANGDYPGVSDATLINDLEKAAEANNLEETRSALTRLFMRFSYNQEYRKRLVELNQKR